MFDEFKCPQTIKTKQRPLSKSLEQFYWSAMDYAYGCEYCRTIQGYVKRKMETDIAKALSNENNEYIHYQTITSEDDLKHMENLIIGLQLLAEGKGIQFGEFTYNEKEGAVKSKITKIKEPKKEIFIER